MAAEPPTGRIEPVRALVTGCAGFIGSHLTEHLLARRCHVLGIDSFSDYYSRDTKLANIAIAREDEDFQLMEADLASMDLTAALDGVDVVFHLAAQPGVRPSWGTQFGRYLNDNVAATQVLLEAVAASSVRRTVFASSSSVYGDAASFPTPETAPQSPVSPYGVTKVAGENLCRIYGKQHGLELTTLRFFTVYGPRQRPDMAFSRFISKALGDQPITVLGDGTQQRDFTYVADIVEGCMLAARAPGVGCFNLGGGAVYELNDVISRIEEILGRRIRVDYFPVAPGDVRSTSADIRRAGSELGYEPQVDFARGLRRQVEWQLTAVR